MFACAQSCTTVLLLLLPWCRCTSVPEQEMPLYEECSPESLFLRDGASSYEAHGFTSRGWDDMNAVMPQFVNLTSIMSTYAQASGRARRVLEQGCGSGRYLLEAQAKFSPVQMFGTNFEKYIYNQADDKPATLITVARHFNLKLVCSHDRRVILPTVVLTPSLASKDFAYPFPLDYFDLIVSRDALNTGKFKSHESHLFIPKMLDVLSSDGGSAYVHLEHGANLVYPHLTGIPYIVCAVYSNLRFKDSSVSILIYKNEIYMAVENPGRSHFGLAMKKCGDTVPGVRQDCTFGNDIGEVKEDETHELSLFDRPPAYEDDSTYEYLASFVKHGGSFRKKIQYTYEYMQNLVQHLRQWEVDGIIT